MPRTSASPLHDPAVHAVIERARTGRGAFPVAPGQDDLMYLICRATGATRVAEFATSLDYIAYVRNPANGFLSMPLPLKGSTELSVRR